MKIIQAKHKKKHRLRYIQETYGGAKQFVETSNIADATRFNDNLVTIYIKYLQENNKVHSYSLIDC